MILGALPDLIVTDVQAPAKISSGNQVTVTWTIKNAGIADALQAGATRFICRTTPTPKRQWQPPSSWRCRRAVPDSLAKDATYSASLTVTLSPSAQGLYWVVIANDAQKPGPVLTLSGVQPPDPKDDFNPVKRGFHHQQHARAGHNGHPSAGELKITDFHVPAVNYSGESMTLSYTVTNVGSYPGRRGTQSWTDFLWIGADPTFIRTCALFLTPVRYSPARRAQPGRRLRGHCDGHASCRDKRTKTPISGLTLTRITICLLCSSNMSPSVN